MQTPQKRRPPSAGPARSRPAGVPQLWQGPSPFEYRGLETESFEETPRRSPTAAPEQAQHAQQASGSPSMPQLPSKVPPLLKRNVEKAAEPQQAHCTSEVMQPGKVGAPGLQLTHVSAAALKNLIPAMVIYTLSHLTSLYKHTSQS